MKRHHWKCLFVNLWILVAGVACETDPCKSSPCASNAVCSQKGVSRDCTCQEGYFGTFGAPYFIGCLPGCAKNNDCPPNEACSNNTCVDPCEGTCGNNTQCSVELHSPVCQCKEGYEGNPDEACHPKDLCKPSPCASNAVCSQKGVSRECTCQEGYFGRFGDPNFIGCLPGCDKNNDCPQNKACSNNTCVDPCEGACGNNTQCSVELHSPVCQCKEGYEGDPDEACHPKDLCKPSPCASNAVCSQKGVSRECTCQEGYFGRFGDPHYIGCLPGCAKNNDCPPNEACSNNTCVDPCEGACGNNTQCSVKYHYPVCQCIEGYEGNPEETCSPKKVDPAIDIDPCVPSPCGPYSICKEVDGHSVCSCKEGYMGSPPSCRPECLDNTECPQNQACMWQKCKDPCPGSCGRNSRCRVINHFPICSCKVGFIGDPFTACQQEPTPTIILDEGQNAIVAEFNSSLKRQCQVIHLDKSRQIETLEWRQVNLDGDHPVNGFMKVQLASVQLDIFLKDSDDNTRFYCRGQLTDKTEITSDIIKIHIKDKRALKLTETCVEHDGGKWNFRVTCAADWATAEVSMECFYKDSTWVYWKPLSNFNFENHQTTITSKHINNDSIESFPQFFCRTDFQNREIVSNIVPSESFVSKCRSEGNVGELNGKENETSKTWVLWISAVGALCVICGAAVTAVLIWRKSCRKTTQSMKPMEEAPEYTYMPIQTTSLYAARNLLASNKRLGPALLPPALPRSLPPSLPPSRKAECEHIYEDTRYV